MSKKEACAIVRRLKEPNKFGEEYRIDFYTYRNGQIGTFLSDYEVSTKDKAMKIIRGNSWVREYYYIRQILELSEDEPVPGHEVKIMTELTPTYMTYKLDIEQFERYLNAWFQKEKGVDINIALYGGSDGDYGYFGLTIKSEDDKSILHTLYGIDKDYDIEYEIIEPLFKELFSSDDVEYEYNGNKDCLMVYVPYEKNRSES